MIALTIWHSHTCLDFKLNNLRAGGLSPAILQS